MTQHKLRRRYGRAASKRGLAFRILIDGEPAGTMAEFVRANPGLDPAELKRLRGLRPGQSVHGGGGAWASYTVTRAGGR